MAALERTGDAMPLKLDRKKRLVVPEKAINGAIKTFLELDGWHVFLLETVSRREWAKFTGEKGMPDMLCLRYAAPVSLPPSFRHVGDAEVLWIESKSKNGRVAQHQSDWHLLERKRGAMVIVAGQDFEPEIEDFIDFYRHSWLQRRPL